MADDAEIVAVATLRDVVPEVYVLPPTEDESSTPTWLVYDGLVFTIDTLVKGDGPEGDDRETVTVRTPVLLVGEDGEPISRMETKHFAIGYDDIGKRYAVFLTLSLVDDELYDLHTPDGVAELVDGKVSVRADRDPKHPLAGLAGLPASQLGDKVKDRAEK